MHGRTTPFSGWTKLGLSCCAVLLVAAGFMAGRFSVQQNATGATFGRRSALILNDNLPVKSARATVVQVQAVVAPSPSLDWDEKSWRRLLASPATPARNAELAAMLEKLAAVDPKKAMALAQAEGNLRLRESLIESALHGWARLAPMDAANFAIALPNPSDRNAAIKSVFAGAVFANPDDAVRMANTLMQQNPGEATSYGNSMIDALCESGNFAAAAQMAASQDSVQQSIWMAEAYSKWAVLQPEAAAQAADAIVDPAARNEALHGVIGGWSQADPAGLTEFLAQQPAGGDRGQMLGQALESWVQLDPVATAKWINDNSSQLGADLDAGMQAVATVNELNPNVAVGWAEGINDENLRSQALTDVLRNWVQTDFAAAKNYFDTTQNLLPADRRQISEIITSISSQQAAQ